MQLHREILLGNAFFLVGEIVLARVDDRVLTEGRVDPAKLRPVGRLGGEFCMPFRELSKVPRPAHLAQQRPAAHVGRRSNHGGRHAHDVRR